MTTVSGGVKGLVARAQREAQRRAQSPSTAHLLLVMLQTGGPMGKLLSELGVKESDLLSAIRLVDSEPTSAVELAVERAYRLAKTTGARQVLPATRGAGGEWQISSRGIQWPTVTHFHGRPEPG